MIPILFVAMRWLTENILQTHHITALKKQRKIRQLLVFFQII